VCNAEYVVERGVLGGYTVKKSKDLLSCTNRNGNLSSLQSETYRVPSVSPAALYLLFYVRLFSKCSLECAHQRLHATACTPERKLAAATRVKCLPLDPVP